MEKKWNIRDPYFYLTTSLIGINATDTQKLSTYHKLFSRLEQKHNAELSVTVNVFVGILSKQLLRKAKSYYNSNDSLTLKDRTISNNTKEEVSDMSEHLSSEKLRACYYLFITNTKGKYMRSQGDASFVINLPLLIVIAVIEVIIILLVP